jgi:hypothetical protein
MTENINALEAVTDIIETIEVVKHYDEDLATGGDPYEVVTLVFKNGELIEERVVRKEDE